MKTYNEKVAKNDDIDLIQVSLDRDANSALKWAKKEKFPWHCIPNKNHKSAKMDKYNVRGVPTYILVDAEGKEITRDRTQVMKKLQGL